MHSRLFISFLAVAAGLAAFDSNAAPLNSSAARVAGSYVLYVENQPGAFASVIAGGAISSSVVVDVAGAEGSYSKKHAGPGQYADISFAVVQPEKPLADWMKATVNTGQPVRKSGSFTATDSTFKEVSRTSWLNGFISDITFPALDAANRE